MIVMDMMRNREDGDHFYPLVLHVCHDKVNTIISCITFIPCQREMALRGLRALKVRRLLKAVRLEFPSTARLTTDTCTFDKCSEI